METDTPALDGGAADPQPAGDQESQAPKGQPDQVQALMRKLRKAEKEAASYREADEKRRQSEMTEAERWKAEAEKHSSELKGLQERLKTQTLQHRFEAAAIKAGVIDPEAAFKLADLSGIDIDENGKVTGIEAAIKGLQQRSYSANQPAQSETLAAILPEATRPAANSIPLNVCVK
jgi:hypothetical protein